MGERGKERKIAAPVFFEFQVTMPRKRARTNDESNSEKVQHKAIKAKEMALLYKH